MADALRPYGAGRQFALLGAAQLDVLTYFAGMQATHGADYAEHALIEGQPALQFIGAKLQERKIEVLLHAGLCAPSTPHFNLIHVSIYSEPPINPKLHLI